LRNYQTRSMATTPKRLKLSPKTLQQLKKASWSEWLDAFNQVHNSTITTSIGTIKVEIEEKRTYVKLKDHGTDLTYENEFKIKDD